MSLLLVAPDRDLQPLKKALLDVDSNLDIETWPDEADKESVQFIVAWNQPKFVLNQYPNLKAVSSLGAGVDHLLDDELLSENIPICRVVADSLIRQMQEYVLNAVLNYHRNTFQYVRQQQQGIWEVHPNKSAQEFTIGIMGLGELGRPVAEQLAGLDYQVRGWSKSPKNIEHVHTFAGTDALPDFCSGADLLVCLLPLTPQTEGILDLDLFKAINHPGYIINVARGKHLVEEDLIYALDKGWLEGATLDVFSEEPLPDRHAFWNRENIVITPHVSSLTQPKDVAPQIVENYKRALSGMELINKIDRQKGY